MAQSNPPRIALLFSQFAAYHMDRCEAVARRLQGRAQVLALEVAATSAAYAWERSGSLDMARKATLFPRSSYENIGTFRKLFAQFRALRHCHMVLIGIPYNRPDIVILAWLLWLFGVRVVLLSESKFDDFPRSLKVELVKALLFGPYCAAIGGGRRHLAYFRFLGFRRRTVLPGYDGVSLERVRSQAGDGQVAYADRHFVFVGRFVAKKNLFELVDAYALYARKAGGGARKLVLAGSGPLEPELRARIGALGLSELVDFPGFLPAAEVSRLLAGSLALVLVSTVEQWGLVVNEALALPVIVSSPVGARDALVRNLVNGYVVETGSVEGLARAMALLSSDEACWRDLSQGSHSRAWLGDAERLADAVEVLLDRHAEPASGRIAAFLAEMGPEPVKGEA